MFPSIKDPDNGANYENFEKTELLPLSFKVTDKKYEYIK